MQVIKMSGQPGAYLVSATKVWLPTADARDAAIARHGAMVELPEGEFRKLGPVVGDRPAGYDAEGVKV